MIGGLTSLSLGALRVPFTYALRVPFTLSPCGLNRIDLATPWEEHAFNLCFTGICTLAMDDIVILVQEACLAYEVTQISRLIVSRF